MSWYKNKQIKESIKSTPRINGPIKNPYKKDGPGDQNGGDGVSYQASPGETGFGSNYTKTKGPKGVDLGFSQDTDDSEMPDLMGDHDGGFSSWESSEATRYRSEQNSSPWFDERSPLGREQQVANYFSNSDKQDKHPAQLSRMTNISSDSVFDEIVSRRKK